MYDKLATICYVKYTLICCYNLIMSVTSTKPTSRRSYVSDDEVAEFCVIDKATINKDLLNKAEELIDGYVGYHKKFMPNELHGKASDVGANSITLQLDQQQVFEVDYFAGCEVEIIGGTGAGQRRKINSSNKLGILIVDTAWATNIDTTSYYSVYQLGKFPRKQDVVCDTINSPITYYKRIPEAIKRAVCAQYEYMVELGAEFFAGGGSNLQSESIGDYSYTNASGETTTNDLVSPKVQSLLGGFINRTGKIIV